MAELGPDVRKIDAGHDQTSIAGLVDDRFQGPEKISDPGDF